MGENQFAAYFKKGNHIFNNRFIGEEIRYCKNIEELYEKCIKPHFDFLFDVDNIKRLNSWCTLIENYIDKEMPIYWIRKYENGKVLKPDGTEDEKEKGKWKAKQVEEQYVSRWNTRRGSLTLVVDNDDNPRYAYAYVSNFDAQEFYNMCFEIEEPNVDEFYAMMKDGSYSMHYDKGGSCLESDIAFFEQTGNTRAGVVNEAGWYFAHINDVNGGYYKNDESLEKIIASLYPLGDTDKMLTDSKETEWVPVKAWQKINSLSEKCKKILENAGISGNTNLNQKSLRIIKLDDKNDIDIQKKILKAHFLRFVHPFNYFLVPAKKYVYNIVKSQIGEYEQLIKFVKGQIHKRIKETQDDELLAHWNFFNTNIMVKSSNACLESEESERELAKLGKEEIHILYGKGIASAQMTGNDKIIIDNSIDFEEKLMFFNPEKQVIKINCNKIENTNIPPISFKNFKEEDYDENSQGDLSIGIHEVYEKLKNKSAIKNELNKLDSDEYLYLTLEIEEKNILSNSGRQSKNNEQPKNESQSNGRAKYEFNGRKYSGSGLLKPIIEDYASKNNISSIDILNSIFGGFLGRKELIVESVEGNDAHYRKLELNGTSAFCFVSFKTEKIDHFISEVNKELGYTINKILPDMN